MEGHHTPNSQGPENSPQEKSSKRSQTAVACKSDACPFAPCIRERSAEKLTDFLLIPGDRCRRRKSRCDGVRPKCGSCAPGDLFCNYRADAPPIIAEKRKNEALQQRCAEQQDLLRALATVSDADALDLLRRLRCGAEIASTLELAGQMQKMYDSRSLMNAFSQDDDRISPLAFATASGSGTSHTDGSASLGAPAPSPMFLEPRVEFKPPLPGPHPPR